MANPKHLKNLEHGVAHWNYWRRTTQAKLHLAGAELAGVDLAGADLTGVDLAGADLTGVNLAGADLTGADLTRTKLRRANLRGANLTEVSSFRVNLSEANLTGTDLMGANLNEASLHAANLTGANLSRANLFGANLFGANLFGADLNGVYCGEADLEEVIFTKCNLAQLDFTNAKVGYTIFAFTSLEECLGLESVKVSHPCSIDFSTLQNSPRVPKSFLRKIGLTDNYINYLPDFFENNGIRLFPVFLSHSSKDKDFTGLLYERLISAGVEVWYDEKQLKPGDNIKEGVHGGISLYDKMNLVCSKESLNSWWIKEEVARIEEKEREYQLEQDNEISLLIPIMIDDEVMNSKTALAVSCRKRIVGDFRTWRKHKKFERALTNLLDALNVTREMKGPTSYL